MTTEAVADLGAEWIRRFGPADHGTPLRLVCFPHAGGSASFFAPLARALSPDVEAVAVQYPGRQDRRNDEPIRSVAELTDRICAALPPFLDRPVAFFGHSMGAILAFEVAVQLERERGIRPMTFFASGRRAPSVGGATEGTHLLDDDGLVRELRRLNGTDAQFLLDEELVQMILPAIRADYVAIETYRGSTEQLGCPLTVLAGDADPLTTLDEALAWTEHTTQETEMQVFPGGHFFVSEHMGDVAATIQDRLASLTHR